MKILMVCMGLNIGGAETHVIQLCSSLLKNNKKNNIKILVASSGGIYEKELEKISIKHFKVPADNKNFFNVIKSFFIIKNIIVNEKIDIVHAHARIPAFICGVIKRFSNINFRFVTTAHWIFETKSIYSRFANWGEKTFVVSEDIKKYLIKKYFVKSENIKVILNAIDTQKFKKERNINNFNFVDVKDKFIFNNKKKYIVHVSRLDKDRSFAAHEIINLAKKVYNIDKNFEILIIGDGNDFDNLNIKAQVINKDLGFKFIYMIGAQTDIKRFLSIAFIFIGVSRSALEAMSCRKIVILFGNEGYLGIFDKNIFEKAYNTNFCCRDFEYNKKKFFKDIKFIFDLEEDKKKDIEDYNRRIINKYYSGKLMSENTLEIYENILEKYKEKEFDIMISGYYGFDNVGDDCMLEAMIKNFKNKNKDIKILVLSNNPKETEKKYNVISINRFNFFLINKFLSKTKMLISGGGSLIQDITSTHSLNYYLYIIKLAIKKNIKVMLLANGIGPIKKSKNKIKVFDVINKVNLITLRDEESIDELKRLNIFKPKIFLTSDVTFSCNDDYHFKSNTELNYKSIIKKKYFIISIRNWKLENYNLFKKNIVDFCEYILKNYNFTPVFVIMHVKKDLIITRQIINNLKIKSVLLKTNNSKKILNLISHAEFVLSMRFHTIVYAIKTLTPIIALSCDPKICSILKEINMSEFCLDLNNLDLEILKKIFEIINKNKIKIKEEIKKKLEFLKSKSIINIELAMKLLEQCI
ncbi:MAG: polysaccharide pyruvyl transferase CsaB [Clostridiales bacterium]|jgi:polysaccharide pyruvyl transferase CsaB|nr:polysaccharide pyruvyl transferase CsaB [Clostridiales bacterium]